MVVDRGCSRLRSALRLMRPRPRQWHCHTTPECHCLDGGSTVACNALELCGCIQRALRATQGRHGEQVQGQLCRRALHSRVDGLDTADHLLSEGLSARDFVTEFSGCACGPAHAGRVSGAVWLRARALSSRLKLTPASLIVAS